MSKAVFIFFSLIALSILSGVKGISFIFMPILFDTAFKIAGATYTITGSPIPLAPNGAELSSSSIIIFLKSMIKLF